MAIVQTAGREVLGAMVRNPKISAKMGNKMNEGMVAPYKKLLHQRSQKRDLTNSEARHPVLSPDALLFVRKEAV